MLNAQINSFFYLCRKNLGDFHKYVTFLFLLKLIRYLQEIF